MRNMSPPMYRDSGAVMVTSLSPFSRSTDMRLMYTVLSVLRMTVSSSDAMTSILPSAGLTLMQYATKPSPMGSFPAMVPPSLFSITPLLYTSPSFWSSPTRNMCPVVTRHPPWDTVKVDPELMVICAFT